MFLLEKNLSADKIVPRTDIRAERTARYSATNGSWLKEAKNPLEKQGVCH